MTALPASTDFTGALVTEGNFKTAISDQRSFLAGLLGADGTSITALQTLGVIGTDTQTLTGAYTVVAVDRGDVFLCSGTWSLSLTAAATLGEGFAFAVINTSTGVITIDPNSTEQIDGATTITIAAGESCIVVCTGTAFRTIAKSYTPPAATPFAIVKLASGTATSAASLQIDFSDYCTVTDYQHYKIIIDNADPVTDGVELWMRTSTDGISYDSTGYKSFTYAHGYTISDEETSATEITLSGGSSSVCNVGNAAGEGFAGEIDLYQTNGTYVRIVHRGGGVSETGAIWVSHGAASRNTAADVVAAEFLFSSGNINTANWTLYGVK